MWNWDSVSSIEKWDNISFWVLIASIILTALATYGTYAFGKRLNELKEQGRRLTELQKQVIISELKKIETSIDPIIVSSKLMDPESISYGKQIHETIEKTGWITRFSPTSFHTFKGMSIFYHPANKKSEYCEFVKTAFQKANVEFETIYYDIRSISLQANDVIYIVIGNK